MRINSKCFSAHTYIETSSRTLLRTPLSGALFFEFAFLFFLCIAVVSAHVVHHLIEVNQVVLQFEYLAHYLLIYQVKLIVLLLIMAQLLLHIQIVKRIFLRSSQHTTNSASFCLK